MPTIRRATLDDLEALVRLRLALLRELGNLAGADEAAVAEAIRRYIVGELPEGRFLAWIGQTEGGEAVACGGLVFVQKPPLAHHLAGREAYIMNMYTEPGWRGRGLAAEIVAAILAHARAVGMPLVRLHASAIGRPVYERAGFRATDDEMLLRLAE